MKKLVPFLLTATLCFAGGIPSQNIRGEYIEARTADVYTGPCFANSEGGLVGELAVFGWKIDKGSWQGVSLDGLSVGLTCVRNRERRVLDAVTVGTGETVDLPVPAQTARQHEADVAARSIGVD